MGQVIPFRRRARPAPLTAETLAAPAILIGAAAFAAYASGMVLIARAALIPFSMWRQ